MNARPWIGVIALTLAAGATARGQAPSSGIQVGDRILLEVEGEPHLTDTFTVGAGPSLLLPTLGAVRLAGVTRAGLEAYLATWLGQYLKHPVVHARALIRLSIDGEVERPGFYAVPVDLVLADALMVAGGLTHDAKMEAIRIERDDRALWRGGALRRALAHGLTLDALGLRAGDRVLVPRRGARALEPTLRVFLLVLALPTAVYGLTRTF